MTGVRSDVGSMPVFVINLERERGRWERLRELETGFTHFDRFAAIDATTLGDISVLEEISDFTKLKILGGRRRTHESIDAAGPMAAAAPFRDP